MTREINIRLNANRAKVVHTGYKFASGDKGIVFKIAVEELETAGTTAKIVFKRSNGTSVEASVEGEDGIYSYTTLGNEFAVIGLVVADVKFYEGEKRISTCTFDFGVTSDTMDGIGAGTAGYSDTLERMKEFMEQTESEMIAVETRAEEILQQMREAAEGAEDDVEAAEKKMADLTAELEALYREYEEAFGTSGPFNPRGAYSATETYTVRDMVTYNDVSWICYRNCTGATPSESSNCWQKLAIQVVDAQTLGGHGAEYFAPKEDFAKYLPLDGSLTSNYNKVSNLDNFFSGICLFTGSIANMPSNGYWLVIACSVETGTVIQLAFDLLQNYGAKQRYKGSGTWGKWVNLKADYLPLTGGLLTGNLTISSETDNGYPTYRLKTPSRDIYIRIEPDGAFRIMDVKDGVSRTILHSSANNTNNFYGHASEDLPLDGGGTVKSAYIAPIALENTANDVSLTAYKGKGALLGYLGMNGLNKPTFQMADGTRKDLLHTGNSAKVHIGTSASSDTASLWYDTANKKVKAYIDGAWTAAA